MKLRTIILAVAASFVALAPLATSAQAQQSSFPGLELQGDQKDACGAIMCLATGQAPSECNPYLQRYFSIVMQKPWQTTNARLQFLQQCPASAQTPQMQALVTAQAFGAGSCDPTSLNAQKQRIAVPGVAGDPPTYISVVSNVMPAVCQAYTTNAYTDQASLTVKYVGTPERGGYWVKPAEYDAAQRQWAARVAAEDAAAAAAAAAQREADMRAPRS